jgi:hypothetical protein
MSADAARINGDADGDHDVDGADFLLWQRNLGASAGPTASNAVPEPTALQFVPTILAIATWRGRRANSSRQQHDEEE